MRKLGIFMFLLLGLFLSSCDIEGNIDDDIVDGIKNAIEDFNPDALDDIDDALKLVTGGSVEGSIKENGTMIYYFYLPSALEVVIDIESDFDSKVVVRNFETKAIVFDGDESIYGDVYTILSLEAGNYELEVSGFNSVAAGNFTVSIGTDDIFYDIELNQAKSMSIANDVVHESIRTFSRQMRELRAAQLAADGGESHYQALPVVVASLRNHYEKSHTAAAKALLDPRFRLEFKVNVISRSSGKILHTLSGSQGGSGGEKEIIASYVLTASLSYALCPDVSARYTASYEVMSQQATVLYNAACPVCRAEIDHYADYSAQNSLSIRFQDLNASQLTHWGLTKDEATKRLHVMKDEMLFSGIPAFLVLWQEMPRYRRWARFVALPGIYWLAVRTYDHILAPALYRWHQLRQKRIAGTST